MKEMYAYRHLQIKYVYTLSSLATPTKWIMKMYPDVRFVTVTLLWDIFPVNVETAEVRQIFQEISVTEVLDFLSEIGLFYII